METERERENILETIFEIRVTKIAADTHLKHGNLIGFCNIL